MGLRSLSSLASFHSLSHLRPSPLPQILSFRCKFFRSYLQSEDGHGADTREFSIWENGGGFFHNSASIHPTAYVQIGAVIHSKSVLAASVRVGSGTVVGPAVSIGQSTKIGYNVALGNCSIGDACVIHNGVCIGQDGKACILELASLTHLESEEAFGAFLGFGFFVDDDGNMLKKPQTLNARIGNDVEIGANTCIDRGSWRDTVIGDHTKIDNLVQIGHNVIIGKNCMFCGQVGIAGSVTIGDYVTLGGRVAVRDHVSIASKVRLAANSCVTKDIGEPGDYGGFPAVPIHKWRRQVVSQYRISSKGKV